MAENKKGFVLYADQRSIIDMLSNEKAGELIKHIFSYVNDENPINNDPLVLLAFEPIKLQLKRDLIKWEDTRSKRSKAGKISAEKRSKQNEHMLTHVQSVEHNSTNSTVIVNDTVNVTVKDIYSFDEFWSTYGKSIDKTKCKAKFEKLSNEVKLKIKEVLPLYVQSTPDKQFRKNPQTWLNGQCWNDEVKTIMKEETVEQMNDRMLYENVMKKINMYHAKD
jgi:hypothetical protein